MAEDTEADARQRDRRRDKLRIALSLISGRVNHESLDNEDWDLLGYDQYRFSGLVAPCSREVLESAEDIILEAICGD